MFLYLASRLDLFSLLINCLPPFICLDILIIVDRARFRLFALFKGFPCRLHIPVFIKTQQTAASIRKGSAPLRSNRSSFFYTT